MPDSIQDRKYKVLMLGWEFPPAMAGGLGVASAEIARSLSQKVDLQLLTPAWEGLPSLEYIQGVGDRHAELYPDSYPYLSDAQVQWGERTVKAEGEAEVGVKAEGSLEEEQEEQDSPRDTESPPAGVSACPCLCRGSCGGGGYCGV
jgi:hypothetical protein